MTADRDDWRDLLRDRDAWDAATQTLDAAEEARDWLSETIMRIDQQFADNRTMGRLPDDEWADHLDWRAAALGFKRVCTGRKRELDRRIKALNRERSEADRDAYLLARARADATIAAEARKAALEEAAAVLDELGDALVINRDDVGSALTAAIVHKCRDAVRTLGADA